MSSNVKNVLYGAKQEAVLTPDVGYEVDCVEVFNKTTNEVVPSRLEKTSDNPPQWTLSFRQPAGVVCIRPKIKPILYSVIIEDCENCSIVLLEYDDAVSIKVGTPTTENAEPQQTNAGGAEQENKENFNEPQHSASEENDAESILNVGENEASETDSQPLAEDISAIEEQEVVVVDEDPTEDFTPDEENPDEEEASEEEVGTHDSVYDAGEFESELEEVEPVVISGKERDKKNDLFWKYRKAFDAGQISKEKFDEIQKKHMQFYDDISSGRIIVEE